MAEIPKDLRSLLFGMGPKWHARVAMVFNSVGMVTLILAIISAAADNALGLGAGNWFLLTIALFLWGLSAWFCAYFGAKEG
jgi:hypothetical protein